MQCSVMHDYDDDDNDDIVRSMFDAVQLISLRMKTNRNE